MYSNNYTLHKETDIRGQNVRLTQHAVLLPPWQERTSEEIAIFDVPMIFQQDHNYVISKSGVRVGGKTRHFPRQLGQKAVNEAMDAATPLFMIGLICGQFNMYKGMYVDYRPH